MKKYIVALLVIVLIAFLAIKIGIFDGIKNEDKVGTEQKDKNNGGKDLTDGKDNIKFKAEDYVNKSENSLIGFMNTKGRNIEIRNLFVEDNKLQRGVFDIYGNVLEEYILGYDNGEVYRVNIEEENKEIKPYINKIKAQNSEKEVILKDPIQLGTKWDNKEITDVAVKINTPSGEFLCIEVTSEEESIEKRSYYSEKVGLIKEVLYNKESKNVDEIVISKIYENSTFINNFNGYYYDIIIGYLVKEKLEYNFKTNDKEIEIITTLVEELENKVGYNMFRGKDINEIEVFENEDYVYIDLKDFTLQGLGSGSESGYINSISNLLIDFYGVSQVQITSNGEILQSGHFDLSEKIKYTEPN